MTSHGPPPRPPLSPPGSICSPRSALKRATNSEKGFTSSGSSLALRPAAGGSGLSAMRLSRPTSLSGSSGGGGAGAGVSLTLSTEAIRGSMDGGGGSSAVAGDAQSQLQVGIFYFVLCAVQCDLVPYAAADVVCDLRRSAQFCLDRGHGVCVHCVLWLCFVFVRWVLDRHLDFQRFLFLFYGVHLHQYGCVYVLVRYYCVSSRESMAPHACEVLKYLSILFVRLSILITLCLLRPA